MKVLILHQYFNTPETGGALRSYYLAKALSERGITTAVITTHNEAGFRRENVEGIEVHYLPIPYSNNFGFIKRVSSFLTFVFSIVKEAGKFKDYDICYAISTPLTIGLAAIWIKWRYRIPYIFEVGDLWPDAPIQVGVVKNSFLKRLLYGLERAIYKRAQSIVALSGAIKMEIDRKLPGKRIDVIPNMADTNFYQPAHKQAALEDKFKVRGKKVISYIGTFGLANGLEQLLDCANAASAFEDVHFILCGTGAMEPLLIKQAAELGLTNVSFIPLQNRVGVQEVLNVTDAAFISYQPLPVLETGSPNKYFDALASGKLIVINFNGWIKDEIEANRCGVYVDPENPEGFVATVLPLLADADQLQYYQRAARQLAEQTYSREKLSENFARIFS